MLKYDCKNTPILPENGIVLLSTLLLLLLIQLPIGYLLLSTQTALQLSKGLITELQQFQATEAGLKKAEYWLTNQLLTGFKPVTLITLPSYEYAGYTIDIKVLPLLEKAFCLMPQREQSHYYHITASSIYTQKSGGVPLILETIVLLPEGSTCPVGVPFRN